MDIPSLQPPPGVTPNFVDPYANVWPTRILTVVFFVLSTIALVARLFTRWRVVHQIRSEDYCIVLGWIGFATLEGTWLAATVDGVGRHLWDINLIQLARFLWLLNLGSMIYNIAIIFAKLSILIQFERIFTGTVKNGVYWTIQLVKCLITLYYIAAVFTAAFACVPREKIWFPWIPGGYCINSELSILLSTCFNLGSDVVMLLIPLYAIWKLKMARRHKWGISAVFATGVLGCLSSSLRVYYSAVLISDPDSSYIYSDIGIAVAAEFTSVILIACAPVMPRLVQYVWPPPPATSTYPTNVSRFSSYYSRYSAPPPSKDTLSDRRASYLSSPRSVVPPMETLYERGESNLKDIEEDSDGLNLPVQYV